MSSQLFFLNNEEEKRESGISIYFSTPTYSEEKKHKTADIFVAEQFV